MKYFKSRLNLRSVRVHLASGSRRIMFLRGGNYYLYLGGLKLEMISGVHPTLSLKPVAGVCSTRGGGCSLYLLLFSIRGKHSQLNFPTNLSDRW